MEIALSLSWECINDLNNVDKLIPPKENEAPATRFISVDLECITAVSGVRIKIPDESDQNRLKKAMGSIIKVEPFNRFNFDSFYRKQWKNLTMYCRN